MLEDRLGLAERLQLAIDIFGLVATRRAEHLLRGAVHHEQEAGLREPLTLSVLAPADCGVDLVAAEEELAGESARMNAAFIRIGLSACDIGVSAAPDKAASDAFAEFDTPIQ